ncbi:MAG: hypothetical protein RLZZ381_2234, partial [Cyanobacteriota bacterium]|jgi:hypothetical protein
LHFKVITHDGNLFVQCGQQLPLQIFPTSELKFIAKAVNTSICFEKDNVGNIVAIILNQGNTQIKAQRQELSSKIAD